MNEKEINYWLNVFQDNSVGYQSHDGKKILLFNIFNALKEMKIENQELKVQINEAIENSNKLLKFINQNFMSNDGFKQFSFKDLLKIKGYCDESLEMLIGTI